MRMSTICWKSYKIYIFWKIKHLLCVEVSGEVLAATLSEILDVVLVSSDKELVALVCQVLQAAAVDEVDHVRHRPEVQVLINDN